MDLVNTAENALILVRTLTADVRDARDADRLPQRDMVLAHLADAEAGLLLAESLLAAYVSQKAHFYGARIRENLRVVGPILLNACAEGDGTHSGDRHSSKTPVAGDTQTFADARNAAIRALKLTAQLEREE